LTPTTIPFQNQQAFQPAIEITQNGSLVVGYYDFRNYTGGSDPNSFLQTDAWLAVYKEVSNPKGGSTRVGLNLLMRALVFIPLIQAPQLQVLVSQSMTIIRCSILSMRPTPLRLRVLIQL
jgi:hypothetical protein